MDMSSLRNLYICILGGNSQKLRNVVFRSYIDKLLLCCIVAPTLLEYSNRNDNYLVNTTNYLRETLRFILLLQKWKNCGISMDKNDDIGHGGLEDDGQSFKETTDSNKFSIPQKLNTVCSRIICSTIISRQGLNKKDQEDRELSKDEDEAFYATLKSKIQTGLSGKNNFAKSMMGNCRLEKKRKNCFNDTSEHIMKKFKENMKHRKSNIQENRPVAIGSSIENLECNDKSTAEKVGKPLCEQDKNILIPTNKNIGIESNSSNKLLAKVTSSIGTDECILSSYIEKTTIMAKEVTEYYFDLQCVTQPPNKSGYET